MLQVLTQQRWGSGSCSSLRKLTMPAAVYRGCLHHQNMTVSLPLMSQAACLLTRLKMPTRLSACYQTDPPMAQCEDNSVIAQHTASWLIEPLSRMTWSLVGV